MRFSVISKTKEYDQVILNTFKDLVGNVIKVFELDNYYIIYHSYDKLNDINSLIMSFQDEFVTNIVCYNSLDLAELKSNEELEICLELIKGVSNGVYDLKKLIINTNIKFNKKSVLEFILNKTGIDEAIINALVECDLNTTKAAQVLYIHRNTLLYKIEKLKEEMNFDLKHFKDVYVLYYLIDFKEDF